MSYLFSKQFDLVVFRIAGYGKHRTTPHQLHIGEVQFVEFSGQVCECLDRIVEQDVSIRMEGREFNPYFISSNSTDQLPHDFQHESYFILNTSAVLVCPLVGVVRQKLVWQVAVC